MKEETTLKRKYLLELYGKFECQEWRRQIYYILCAHPLFSDEDNLVIDQDSLEILRTKGTKEQKKLVATYGIVVKSVKNEIHLFLSEMFDNCTVRVVSGHILFEKPELGILFEQDSKNKYFWFRYKHIWLVLNTKYDLNEQEIKDLLSTWLEEHLKLQGFTPRLVGFLSSFCWKNT